MEAGRSIEPKPGVNESRWKTEDGSVTRKQRAREEEMMMTTTKLMLLLLLQAGERWTKAKLLV
jgi:hypothetical protein